MSQALALEVASERPEEEGAMSPPDEVPTVLFYEITIAAVDQAKLLSRMTQGLVRPRCMLGTASCLPQARR